MKNIRNTSEKYSDFQNKYGKWLITEQRNPPRIMISKERNPRPSNKVYMFTTPNKHRDREKAKDL